MSDLIRFVFPGLLLIGLAEAHADDYRVWTDTTGNHRIEAQFIKIDGENVTLKRKRDSTQIVVPLDRLSADSQQQARRLQKEQNKNNEGPLPSVPADGPPPALPRMANDLAWKEQFKKDIDKVIANYEHDQVSAYLTFRKILDQETDGPGGEQMEWLELAAAACRARALAVVTADFVRAVEMSDIRSTLVASIVASKIHPSGVGGKASSLAVLKNRLFSAEPPDQSIWTVEEVSASEINGAYSEGNAFAHNQITITPKETFRLVRVTAKVTNAGVDPDLPYIKWSFGGLKLAMIDALSSDMATADKPRLAMDEFIVLVTAGGDWINCVHVCDSSTVLRQLSVTIQGSNDGVIAIGGYVSANKSFKMDLLFTVPKGIDEAKLLVLGANPKLIAFERKAADEKAAADKKAAEDPPTIQDDLKALAGDKETTWELSQKDAQASTIRLTFYRDKDANSKFGRLWVISDTKAAVSSFEFKIEEKDKRRFLNATEDAFEGEGAETRLPYVLEGDTLRIAGGKASNREFGIVELKGEWKRAKK